MCAQRIRKSEQSSEAKAVKNARKSSAGSKDSIAESGQRKRQQLRECTSLTRTDPAESLRQILDIRKWARKNNDIGLLARSTAYAADACMFLSREDDARKYVLEGEKLLESIPGQDIEVHRQLAEVYEHMGDFKQSAEHQKKMFDLYKSVVGVERQQAVATVELRYSMLAAQKDREILQLRAEKAEHDSEMKTRELSAIALQLTQRNEAFKTLQKIVDPYVKEGRGQTKQLASTVRKSIMAAVDTHGEWKVFEEQFERVHQDFIRTLKARCPELTPTELRICVLIRLNLSSKQIADTLFTSLLTVKTHRVNIRRKLQLGEDNLTGFLMAI